MNYKNYIGPEKEYENIGKIVFQALLNQGLEKYHKVLDIGCGSLRVGQHLINYLGKGNYFGIEPNKWLIEEALKHEKIKNNKNPTFDFNDKFIIPFDERFDFVLANSIFIHASKNQIENCFNEVDKKINGKFLFNFIPGSDNKKLIWSYPGAVTYSRVYFESLREFKYVQIKYPGKQIFGLYEKYQKEEIKEKDYECEE